MKVQEQQLVRLVELARQYGATRLVLFGSALENPEMARDLDLACAGVPGWKIYELGARIEEELQVSLDLIPLYPPNPFTRLIERHGRDLM